MRVNRIFGCINIWRSAAVWPVIALALAAACGPAGPAADTVFYNGRIVTVDSSFSIVRAVAIHADTFMAAGSDEQILKLAGPETEKIDLDGRMALPGLIEAHAHPERASLSEKEMPLDNPRTVKQCLDWVAKIVERREPGEWIIHDKLFATRLADLRPPNLAELDSVAPDNPVFLNGSYGGSINSAAMKASGINNSTEHSGLMNWTLPSCQPVGPVTMSNSIRTVSDALSELACVSAARNVHHPLEVQQSLSPGLSSSQSKAELTVNVCVIGTCGLS